MADIFNEVDEEVRRERLKQIWDRYGTLLIAAAVIVVLGVAGWRGYEYWQARQARQAGAAYDSAVTLAREGKTAEAEAAFSKLASQAPHGYELLARLREAGEIGQRDAKAGAQRFDAIAADSSVPMPMQDLARLRAALLLVDTASYDDIKQRLQPLTDPTRPFRHSAREVLALSAWRNGDAAAAKTWIEAIEGDPATPQGIRSRAEVLSALIAGHGKS